MLFKSFPTELKLAVGQLLNSGINSSLCFKEATGLLADLRYECRGGFFVLGHCCRGGFQEAHTPGAALGYLGLRS